jgi:hypothetical protein
VVAIIFLSPVDDCPNALKDIQDLIEKGVLAKEPGGGRNILTFNNDLTYSIKLFRKF